MAHPADPHGIVVQLIPPSRKKGARRLRRGSMTSLKRAELALPFFRERTRTKDACWWHVEPTGQYSKDCSTGEKYAEALMPLMHCVAGPIFLPRIFGDMIKAVGRRRGATRLRGDRLSGIEIGFMIGLGRLIVAGTAATMYVGAKGKLGRVTTGDLKATNRFIALLARRERQSGERMWEKVKAELAASEKAAAA